MLTTILISAVVLLFLPLFIILFLGIIARTSSLPFDLLQQVDMPEEHRQKARQCFKDVRKKSINDILYDCTAPYVMLLILPFVRWDAENLPTAFSAWDNEVSMNGDRVVPCPVEDTPEVRALCYYAKGKHPRSFWARYVWLGWRNRASKKAFDNGIEVTRELIHDTELWGNASLTPENPGTLVRRMGDYYEIFSYKNIGKSFTRRVRYGYKIGNGLLFGAKRVMLVSIGVSYKRKK